MVPTSTVPVISGNPTKEINKASSTSELPLSSRQNLPSGLADESHARTHLTPLPKNVPIAYSITFAVDEIFTVPRFWLAVQLSFPPPCIVSDCPTMPISVLVVDPLFNRMAALGA